MSEHTLLITLSLDNSDDETSEDMKRIVCDSLEDTNVFTVSKIEIVTPKDDALTLEQERTLEGEIRDTLLQVLDGYHALGIWLTTPIPALDNKTGKELMTEHRQQELLDYVKTYLDPSFS